jgi:hypothetical protein
MDVVMRRLAGSILGLVGLAGTAISMPCRTVFAILNWKELGQEAGAS